MRPAQPSIAPTIAPTESHVGVIYPSSPDRFLPAIGHLPMLGGLVLLVIFGGTVALSSILSYKVTVKAPGVIRPVGELRIVQAATEGMVKSVTVEENQTVRQGDLIATIEDSRLQTRKNQLAGAMQQAEQQLRQLTSQLAALDRQIAAEAEQAQRSIAFANAELNLNQRTHEDQLITTQSEVQEAKAAVELARDELSRYQQLSGTGAIAQIQVKEKEAALKTTQARLERFAAALNPSVEPMSMAREKIAQERARGAVSLAALQKEREQLLQKQVELQSQVERDRKDRQQVETDLKNTIIRAPIAGVIQALTLRNPAQVVQAGERVAQIVPTQAALRLKAVVAAQDIDQVKVGQRTLMRVSACAYPDYGTLAGRVTSIAPDTVAPTQANSRESQAGGESAVGRVYSVNIQPETLILQIQGRRCPIQAGMEGNIEIITREETVLQFFRRKARLMTGV
jgi:HlyD family type I secretion membrane fusion protein